MDSGFRRPHGRTGLRSQASESALVGRKPELARLEELLAIARGGGSGVLVVHGDPGVGKSALLDQLIASASGFEVVRASGVEGEVDLPYAGLHQLCRSMTDTISALPQPQSDALSVAFGRSTGDAPDRYVVGLATLSLMSEVAATKPLLCVVDDVQWLDPQTTQALAFVARRLGADSVALVFASRETSQELADVPELHLGGLSATDSRVLLDSVLMGHLDGAVRERILAETHGNPLALIELPRALTPAEAASGMIGVSSDSLSTRIEAAFGHQLESLPDDTRQLLVLAAAEPLGDPLLLVHAATGLGLSVESADPAEEAGLFQIREWCSFRHPLVRSAVYRSASQRERRLAHRALAEATDRELDPDRRAWHRAQATAAPDEDVATELERTAARAKARGGLAAAGAFLERAALLTPDAGRRARRALAAAEVMFDAGAYDAVERLLRVVDTAKLDELDTARAEWLSARVPLKLTVAAKEPILKLIAAAEQLSRLDAPLGRAAYLYTLAVSFGFANPETLTAFLEATDAFPSHESAPTVELVVRGWAQLLEQGYPAGTDLLRRAMVELRERPLLEEADLPLLWFTGGVAASTWDLDSWESLARRAVQIARDAGALPALAEALDDWASAKVATGEFSAAAVALAEAEAIGDVIRREGGLTSPVLNAWQLEESEALGRIDLLERIDTRDWCECFRARVYNGAARYTSALEAAQRSCDCHPLGTMTWALVELVEAAVRCGELERARVAFEQLADRTQLASTEWALGLQARSAALLEGDQAAAESQYQEAIDRLGRARARPDLARAHLVYGEWLRRENRRIEAREQLRTAHDMFSQIGIPGFADRARRELAATGETPRKRSDDTRGELTAQESQIAQLAAEGMTNPEIGAKLFLSPRTIEWHLRNVYSKLGVDSRRELPAVLSPT